MYIKIILLIYYYTAQIDKIEKILSYDNLDNITIIENDTINYLANTIKNYIPNIEIGTTENKICLKAYYNICPMNWKLELKQNQTICTSNELDTDCPINEVDVTDFDDSKKEYFAQICNTYYPCIENKEVTNADCEKNYYDCPLYFKKSNKLLVCKPDITQYTGLCLYETNFTNYTIEMKKEWANQCKTDWQCKTSSTTASTINKRKQVSTPYTEYINNAINNATIDATNEIERIKNSVRRNNYIKYNSGPITYSGIVMNVDNGIL